MAKARQHGGNVAFLGIDIGSATTRAALIDEDLHMVALANTSTHIDGTFETPMLDVRTATAKALAQAGFRAGSIEGVCISVSGVVDDAQGRAFSPVLGWVEPMEVRSIAQGVIDVPVFVANDAQAAAVGEAHYGAGIPYERFALVRLGTLIEVAMVIDGVAVEDDALPAQAATEGEFLLVAHELIDTDNDDGLDLSGVGLGRIRSSQVTEEARHGNPVAVRAVDWLAARMTEGIVGTCVQYAPQAAVVSGATQRDRIYLSRLITRKLAETRSALAGVPVECAALGNDAKAFGSAVIALQRA